MKKDYILPHSTPIELFAEGSIMNSSDFETGGPTDDNADGGFTQKKKDPTIWENGSHSIWGER